MKMIMAIVRPDKLKEVGDSLKNAGHPSLTEFSVRGRGKQRGITIGGMRYEKLPKELLITVCNDGDAAILVDIILGTARTGNVGDGKIFILDVDDAVTIRTGQRGEASL